MNIALLIIIIVVALLFVTMQKEHESIENLSTTRPICGGRDCARSKCCISDRCAPCSQNLARISDDIDANASPAVLKVKEMIIIANQNNAIIDPAFMPKRSNTIVDPLFTPHN